MMPRQGLSVATYRESRVLALGFSLEPFPIRGYRPFVRIRPLPLPRLSRISVQRKSFDDGLVSGDSDLDAQTGRGCTPVSFRQFFGFWGQGSLRESMVQV